MMKTTRIILFLGLLLGVTHWAQAQVKIGDRHLDIGNERLLEMERAGELFIVTDSLEIGITTSILNNVPGTDAMMVKLYGYGLGNFGGNQSYFLGTNASGEVMEFPLTLDLLTTSTTARLYLDNGTSLFDSIDLTNLDSFFVNNTQLTDSLVDIRTLVANNKANDLDTIEGNELIVQMQMIPNLTDGEFTVLEITENQVDPSKTSVIDVDLNLALTSFENVSDTADALRDLIFYKIDGTLEEDRTVTGASNRLTFTGIDSFEVSSANTTLASSVNTAITSGGTTTVTSTGDISATSSSGNVSVSSTTGTVGITGDGNVNMTSANGDVNITSTNSDVIIDASTDSIEMIGVVRLNEYPAKPTETVFNNILGIDANGNVINIAAATILGTETDSVIYRHDGTLISDRTLSGAGNSLTFTTLDSFNVSSNNTELSTSGNTGITSGGTTTVSSTGDISATSSTGNVSVASTTGTMTISSGGTTTVSSTGDISATSSTGNVSVTSSTGTVDVTGDGNVTVASTTGTMAITSDGNASLTSANGDVSITSSNSDITIDASTDSIEMIGTVRLNEYPAKPNETTFNNILGIDAAGNVINIAAASILGTETDSVIYRHNGTLTSERTMTMGSVPTPHNLMFVSPDGADTTLIANDGRLAVGTGSFTPNSATSNVKLEVNGDILAVRVHSSSDRRFKKNITPIGSALEKVMQIEGVTYDFKTEEFASRRFPTDEQVGFIAQNVESVLPQVVRTNGDGYKAVDYAKMTALLNEAIKEQQGQISNQEQIIENQQELITSLLNQFSVMNQEIAELKSSVKRVSNQTMSEE